MDQVKSWLQSKGVWGGIIATVASLGNMIGPMLGFSIDQAAVGEATTILGTIADNLVSIIGAVGGILAVIGRIFAKKAIG